MGAGAARCGTPRYFARLRELVARLPAPRLRPGLVRGRCDLGQPFFISEYDSSDTVERDFARLVPACLRLLMLPTSEFFFFAMMDVDTSFVPPLRRDQSSTLRNAPSAPTTATMPVTSSTCAPNTSSNLKRASAGSSSMPYITA